MAKKFFYNRVYNTKRTIINLVIIGVCIIGVIICFIITSNFQGENHNTPEGALSIKSEVTVEVNEDFTKEIFFSKVQNVNLDEIEIIYPESYSVSNIGRYEVTIKINDKNYNSTLIVVDTTQPKLTLKELVIDSKDNYTSKDFIENCYDNSNIDCEISFYSEGIDEEGNAIDYSSYKEDGTYPIKISAKDQSGNQIVKETKLTIGKKVDDAPTQEPINCKYGNNVYDIENYLVAIDITSNTCAVSLDLYKDSGMTTDINKLMESETTKIKKDVDALNLTGTLALNRKVTAVINKSGDGVVGYELRMSVTITNNDKSEVVVDYKVDNNGKRVFITNPHDLAN